MSKSARNIFFRVIGLISGLLLYATWTVLTTGQLPNDLDRSAVGAVTAIAAWTVIEQVFDETSKKD